MDVQKTLTFQFTVSTRSIKRYRKDLLKTGHRRVQICITAGKSTSSDMERVRRW